MKKIREIDSFLLGRCQSVCNSIQRQTGFTNFSLCRFMNIVLMIWDCFFLHRSDTSWLRPGYYCVMLLYTFIIEKINDVSSGKGVSAHVNPAVYTLLPIRYLSYSLNFLEIILILICLVLFLFLFVLKADNLEKFLGDLLHLFKLELLSVSVTIFIVMLSCTPLPPCTGKLWEKFDFFNKEATQTS